MGFYVRLIWLGAIFACLLFSLVLEIRVLCEIRRETKQRHGKPYKRPSEANDSSGLDICPNVKSTKQRSKARQSSRYETYGIPTGWCAKSFLVNISKQSWDFLSQILFNKLKNALAFLFFGLVRHKADKPKREGIRITRTKTEQHLAILYDIYCLMSWSRAGNSLGVVPCRAQALMGKSTKTDLSRAKIISCLASIPVDLCSKNVEQVDLLPITDLFGGLLASFHGHVIVSRS
jgi:hypothetical protein